MSSTVTVFSESSPFSFHEVKATLVVTKYIHHLQFRIRTRQPMQRAQVHNNIFSIIILSQANIQPFSLNLRRKIAKRRFEFNNVRRNELELFCILNFVCLQRKFQISISIRLFETI